MLQGPHVQFYDTLQLYSVAINTMYSNSSQFIAGLMSIL